MKKILEKFKVTFSDKKKRNKMIIASVFSFLLLGLTFAFLMPIVGDIAKTNILVHGHQIDKLIFKKGEDLIFTPSMSNLPENGENYTASTMAVAEITANSETNEYIASYYVALNVKVNEYIYTTEDETPELILTVTKPDGTEVTEIEGLTYYANTNGLSGFDVTTFSGLVQVVENFESTSTSSTTPKIDEWTFTISMANLESNQALNGGKDFKAVIAMSASEYTPINNYIVSLAGNGQVVHETFVDSESSLANSEGIVDTGYRYEGANPDNYVTFNNETWRIIGAFDTEVTNSDGTHTTEKLVKIIRKDMLGYYSRDNSNTGDGIDSNNNWPTSDLFHLLNESYLNAENGTNGVAENSYCWSSSSAGTCDFTNSGIQDNSRDMVEKVKWNLGGVSDNDSTSSDFYKLEKDTNVYSSDRATEVDAHIGLIYISDYGFSALENTCSRDLVVYNYGAIDECYGENWLFRGAVYRSIVPHSSSNGHSWNVVNTGHASSSSSNQANETVPVLYLKSSVGIDSGAGTESDPYVLS